MEIQTCDLNRVFIVADLLNFACSKKTILSENKIV